MNISHDAERENYLRWDRKPGHYEVYYLTFNHLKSESGFWIRYTMTAPDADKGDAYAQIWFSYFNRRDPEKNFALKKKYPIDQLNAKENPFSLSVGENSLRNGHAVGSIAGNGHSAAWDITFTPSAGVYYMLPKFMYKTELADTLALVPHLDVKFSGSINVDGDTLSFDGDPGCQTHLWGSEHAQRWAWAHCNAFEEDDSAVIECLSAQVKRLGIMIPPMNMFFIRAGGRDYLLTELNKLIFTKSEFDCGDWTFSSTDGNTKFKGKFSCRMDDLVEAEYFDPNGHKAYCRNTEVGDLTLEIYSRSSILAPWRLDKTLSARGTAHMEFASRARDPRVKKEIVEAV